MQEACVNAVNNASWALGLLVQNLPAAESAALTMPAAERLIALLQVRATLLAVWFS